MRSSPRGTPGSERAHRVPPGREPAVTAALSPGPARGCRRPRSGPRCCPSAAGPRGRADTAARSCGPGQRRPPRERRQLWNNRNNRNNRDNRDAPILLGAAASGPHLRLWRKHRRTAQPREGDDAGPLGRACLSGYRPSPACSADPAPLQPSGGRGGCGAAPGPGKAALPQQRRRRRRPAAILGLRSARPPSSAAATPTPPRPHRGHAHPGHSES